MFRADKLSQKIRQISPNTGSYNIAENLLQSARMSPFQGVSLSKSLPVSAKPSTEDSFTAWLICLSAGLFFFYEFFQLNLFDVINQLLRQEFLLNAAELSWMSSTFVWGNVLFLIPAGLILDRYSARSVILCALSVCIVGVFGFGFSHALVSAVFFHTLTGIGNAFCFLSCVILVSRWFAPQRQALVIGCIVTMAFLGGMSAHTPFAYLNAHFGWRQAVIVDGVLGLLILAWITFVVKDKPMAVHTPIKKKTLGRDLIQAIRYLQNSYAGLYTACLNLPIMVVCALWGASYLNQVHAVSSFEASHVVSYIFIGSIVGCPLVGWLSDQHGQRKPSMLIGALLTMALTTCLVLPITFSPLTLKLLFFTLGLCTSTQVLTYPFIADNNPAHLTGTATAIASILVMGSGGIAQILFGTLLQYHAQSLSSQYTTSDYRFAMWIFPVSAFVASVMVLLMKERTKK